MTMFKRLIEKFNSTSDKHDSQMPLALKNYILIGAGLIIIILGMVLNHDEFGYAMFSWRRITLAPILIVGGFAFEIYAIMKRF